MSARSFWRERSVEAAAALLMWFCILWVLAIPCFTDGHEGNRMRFSVSALFTILTLKPLNDSWRAWRRRHDKAAGTGDDDRFEIR